MSEEAKHGKPLKLGFLFILAPGKLKRVFKYRFCILTTFKELDWFKKQEDCQEHKRGGYINVDGCDIEEIEDVLGQPFCFQVKLGSKTSVLAAESHQDRVNWIVEILKFRGIPGLIQLLDSADLSKHAAYALANLAGRKSDDSQIEIVRCGAIGPLLEFQRKCEDETLVETIYYAFSKLSSRDENRLTIGKHLPALFLLLEGPQERWKEFVLMTAVNCATHPQIRTIIRKNDDIARILGTLCSKSTGEKLQLLCLEALIMCSEEVETKRMIIDSHLPLLAEIIHNLPVASQVETVRLIACCAEDKEHGISTMADIRIVRSLVPLLDSDSTTLLAALLSLFETLITSEKHREGIRACYALPHIISAITCCDKQPVSSDTVLVIESAVQIIGQVWEDEEHVCTLASHAQQLLPIIQLLAHDNKTIHQKSLRVLHQVCLPAKSRLILGDHEDAVHALLHGLLHLISSKSYDNDTLTLALSTLCDVAEVDAVKVDMCREQVLEKIVGFVLGESKSSESMPALMRDSAASSFSLPADMAEKVMAVISKCTTGIMGKWTLSRLPGRLAGVLSFISSSRDLVRVHVLEIASNCVLVEEGLKIVVEENIPQHAVRFLDVAKYSPDTILPTLKMFSNMLFSDEFSSSKTGLDLVGPIVSLLASENILVQLAASRALRNCCCCNLPKDALTNKLWEALFSPIEKFAAHSSSGSESGDAGAKMDCESKRRTSQSLLSQHSPREISDPVERVLMDVLLFLRQLLLHAHGCTTCDRENRESIFARILEHNGLSRFLSVIDKCKSSRVLAIAAGCLDLSLRNDESRTALGKLDQQYHCLFSRLGNENGRAQQVLLSVIASACHMEGPLLEKFLTAEHIDCTASFMASRDITCSRLAADILFRCSYLCERRSALKRHLGEVAKTLIKLEDTTPKHSLAGIILNCMVNDDDSIQSSNHLSLLHFLLASKSDAVKTINDCEWNMHMESNADDHIVRVTASPAPALSFSFPNADLLNVHTAIAIACAQFDIPVESSLRPQLRGHTSEGTADGAQSEGSLKSSGAPGSVLTSPEKDSDNALSMPSGFQAAATPLKERATKGVRMGGNRKIASQESRTTTGAPTTPAPDPPSERVQQYERRTLEILRQKLGQIAEPLIAAAIYDVIMHPTHVQYLDAMQVSILESYAKIRSRPDEAQSIPRALRTDSPLVEISEDGFRARYIGESDEFSVGAVKGSHSNVSRSGFSYFEVAVVSSGEHGYIGVGLTIATYPDNQQPGWSKGSWAYHGDDGNRFWVIITENDEFHNDSYGPYYETGDIIGCGYNNINGDVFFTKNGEYLGVAFREVPRNLFPCVGLGSRGEEIYVNFGQHPFLWKMDTRAPSVPITPAPKAFEQPGEGQRTQEARDPGPLLHVFECMKNEWTFMT